MFRVHVQSRALIKATPKQGAATTDSLTSTPTCLRQGDGGQFHSDKGRSLGLGVGLLGERVLDVHFDYRGIIKSFGQSGH